MRKDTAVALHYTEDLPAPLILASGRGAVAEAIMRIARETGVPIVERPELAASLMELDINTLIPENLYEVVAQLLVFIRAVKASA
jgi:flagellar biosynthesis protein